MEHLCESQITEEQSQRESFAVLYFVMPGEDVNKADVTDCEGRTANTANRKYFIEHLCQTLESAS